MERSGFFAGFGWRACLLVCETFLQLSLLTLKNYLIYYPLHLNSGRTLGSFGARFESSGDIGAFRVLLKTTLHFVDKWGAHIPYSAGTVSFTSW